MAQRLSLALASGHATLPAEGRVLVIGPEAGFDFGDLSADRVVAVQGFFPDHDAIRAAGWAVEAVVPDGPFAAAVVCIAKAKAATLDRIAQAMAALPADAPIIVDGAKTAGIDSIYKQCRTMFRTTPAFSKAHGKVFAFPNVAVVPDGWRDGPREVAGFRTAAGVFSADHVDPGSAALAKALPNLKGTVCDLGAGWGYLSAQALEHSGVTHLDAVEAEWTALACARHNLTDPRAAFHWADARDWAGRYDWILSNPPFHTGRDATPELGRAFIETARRCLAPRGTFIMVANRHLPYEATLAACFAEVVVMSDTGGYKVISAKRPIKR